MPEDWDEEEDGEWEAPQIKNPACKAAPGCGEWKRPMIDNPDYKGKWVHPMIDNPDYVGEWNPKQIPNRPQTTNNVSHNCMKDNKSMIICHLPSSWTTMGLHV